MEGERVQVRSLFAAVEKAEDVAVRAYERGGRRRRTAVSKGKRWDLRWRVGWL